jgi:hypothetical protein
MSDGRHLRTVGFPMAISVTDGFDLPKDSFDVGKRRPCGVPPSLPKDLGAVPT